MYVYDIDTSSKRYCVLHCLRPVIVLLFRSSELLLGDAAVSVFEHDGASGMQSS
jgi:hypothetical protein